jgi:hypothetical protein
VCSSTALAPVAEPVLGFSFLVVFSSHREIASTLSFNFFCKTLMYRI